MGNKGTHVFADSNAGTYYDLSQASLQNLVVQKVKDGVPVQGADLVNCGNMEKFQTDPDWQNLLLFHEYFHGDSGAGVGANHQTGWTGLVIKLMQQSGERARRKDLSLQLVA